MRIIGAGFPRTGTTSLSLALARLLGEPCYHMSEFFARPEHAPTWAAALRGESVDWRALLAPYAAGVDTPLCMFWRDLAEEYPDAPVLLSQRADAETWYASMEPTVLAQLRRHLPGGAYDGTLPPWLAEVPAHLREDLSAVFTGIGSRLLGGNLDDPDGVRQAYRDHLDDVRASVPPDRLVPWQPGDGWEPLCAALGVPVPDEEFPHANTRDEFVARASR